MTVNVSIFTDLDDENCYQQGIAASVAEVLLCGLTNNTASDYLYPTALLPMPHLTAMLQRYVAFDQTSMIKSQSRQTQIEILAGDGNIEELKKLFKLGYTQLEIDTALENAVAYSQIETAEHLLSLGADFSNYDYQGTYYAVHNNELKGLKFAISKGVDINVNNGMLLNEGIMTATNTKSVEMVKWLLENGANPKLLSPQSLRLVEEYGTDELKSVIRNAT